MSTTSQASQRIAALLDENSFVEIGARVTARSTDFNLKQTETPSDGVITGSYYWESPSPPRSDQYCPCLPLRRGSKAPCWWNRS